MSHPCPLCLPATVAMLSLLPGRRPVGRGSTLHGCRVRLRARRWSDRTVLGWRGANSRRHSTIIRAADYSLHLGTPPSAPAHGQRLPCPQESPLRGQLQGRLDLFVILTLGPDTAAAQPHRSSDLFADLRDSTPVTRTRLPIAPPCASASRRSCPAFPQPSFFLPSSPASGSVHTALFPLCFTICFLLGTSALPQPSVSSLPRSLAPLLVIALRRRCERRRWRPPFL